MDPYDQSTRILIRNTPDDDYSGLSPNQVHYLYYDTFDENSSLQFNTGIDDSVLDQIPFFRLTEALIHIIKREQRLKLTATGALPRKVLEELYSHKFIPEYYIDYFIEKGIFKQIREDKCISLRCSSDVVQNSGLVEKAAGKIFLTEKGIRLLEPNNRLELFKCIFETFTQNINWSENDRYSEDEVAQWGWAYSIYLLLKFGDQQRTIEFYAEKYLIAFPDFINSFPDTYHLTPKEMFLRCYGVRTLERFFEWFGFVNIKPRKKLLERHNDTFTSSELLNKIFEFD